ncbi:hypothetical protein FRC17_008377, partial [Serendipita sp. 399]
MKTDYATTSRGNAWTVANNDTSHSELGALSWNMKSLGTTTGSEYYIESESGSGSDSGSGN